MLDSSFTEADKQRSEKPDVDIEPFQTTLSKHGINLTRGETRTLQVNTGFLCNQSCQHCHLSAGPGSKANMNRKTVEAVLAYAERGRFETIDITGGAPDLNPYIRDLVKGAGRSASRVMFRSNLSALNDGHRDDLMHLLKENRVVIVASFPSLNASQTDAQRGGGIFERSLEAFKKLNDLGYGMEGTGLELNLVSNPTGAFLPPDQKQTEKRFHVQLATKWGLHFNNLFSFANVPLGRFRDWLVASGNFSAYMEKLKNAFNPCAVTGLMCRSMISVSWDGYLFDCDFNLARRLHMGGRKTHVSQMSGVPEYDSGIVTADHCYTCTAGSGFT
ncbi:MAG: arsenosugar biosynthesis radical SAM protein ArsS [Deltaproteobacteria bacterium]|nr:arsenosugar biosynthesis radical SAM protein ArsS [Deltaproteobacteria bacterium]MBW2298486.1 arsenosugar biosynthesis radical SAM protein ArsS [Deltaproteobacteria bacterium]